MYIYMIIKSMGTLAYKPIIVHTQIPLKSLNESDPIKVEAIQLAYSL